MLRQKLVEYISKKIKMKRTLVLRFTTLLMLVIFVSACSKKTEYTNVIPNNISAVVSINVKAIFNKAGLDQKNNHGLKQKMIDALKQDLDAKIFEQAQKIINNPSESGLDLNAPLYLFTSPTFTTPVVVAKVRNYKKLNSLIQTLSADQVCQPIAKKNNYHFTSFDNNLLIFNKSAVLLITLNDKFDLEKAKSIADNLMKRKDKQNITNTPNIKKALKGNNDINFFTSLAAIPKAYNGIMRIAIPTQINSEEINISGSLNFENGKINLQFKNSSSDPKVNALLEKRSAFIHPLNGTFIKDFPISVFAFLNINVNGRELFNMIHNNPDFQNNISLAQESEIKKVFDAINGDIAIGLTDLTLTGMPSFIAFAEVKNEKVLNTLFDNMKLFGLPPGSVLKKTDNNHYIFNDLYIGIRNKKEMYITNNKTIGSNINQVPTKSLVNAPYATDIKGKKIFFALDMNSLLNLSTTKVLSTFGGNQYQLYSLMASQISYIEGFNGKEGDTEIHLMLKNKEENALKQILDFAKHITGM